MKSPIKPKRLNTKDIAAVAAAGVERALQARELTEREIAEVSGGLSTSVSPLQFKSVPIIAGGIFGDIFGKLDTLGGLDQTFGNDMMPGL